MWWLIRFYFSKSLTYILAKYSLFNQLAVKIILRYLRLNTQAKQTVSEVMEIMRLFVHCWSFWDGHILKGAFGWLLCFVCFLTSRFFFLQLSFGGIPLPGKPGTFLRKNFHGCMENLYYNGINIIDLAKRRKPQIHSVVSVAFCLRCVSCAATKQIKYFL